MVSRISEQVQSDAALMLRLKNIGIQPGREVTLAASDNGVRVTGADKVGDVGGGAARSRSPRMSLSRGCDGREVSRGMRPPGEAPQPLLTASDVLEQVATGVVVIDRDSALLYANHLRSRCSAFPMIPSHLAGRPLLSLGIERSDAADRAAMAENVLRGWPWEGTFASQRIDGSRVFVRAHAVPLRGRAAARSPAS